MRPRDVKQRRRVTRNGVTKYGYRVVMESALGRELTHDELVHHKDGSEHNNSSDNLELVAKDQHMLIHAPLINYGKKLTKDDVVKIRELRQTGMSTYKLGTMFNVHQHTISNICLGRTWICVPEITNQAIR